MGGLIFICLVSGEGKCGNLCHRVHRFLWFIFEIRGIKKKLGEFLEANMSFDESGETSMVRTMVKVDTYEGSKVDMEI